MTLTSITVTKHSKWYLKLIKRFRRHYPCRLVGFICAWHRNFARRCHQARNVEHFDFDLTCDVTRDPEVNKICFPSTVFPGLSNAALIFRIGPVVSEIRGGARNSPPPSGARYKKYPSGTGVKIWFVVIFINFVLQKTNKLRVQDCLHASDAELRHICISKRWGSKLPPMKAAKVNINKRILSTICFFALLHLSLRWDKNCGIPAWYQYLQWAKPHDATKLPQLLCVKLEDLKKYIPGPEAITCCHTPGIYLITRHTTAN